jgi:hypothetical protein
MSLYNPWHGQRRKHRLSSIEKACLLIRCLAVDVLLLCPLVSSGNVFTQSLTSIRYTRNIIKMDIKGKVSQVAKWIQMIPDMNR